MKVLKHRFVDKIPEQLEENVIYISIPFETVIHKCCCGCGNEVVTPLSPTDWRLTFDGKSITLDPSIGSWSLDCKSHYYIRKNKVVWSVSYSDQEIEEVRTIDLRDKFKYYSVSDSNKEDRLNSKTEKVKKSFWDWLFPKR